MYTLRNSRMSTLCCQVMYIPLQLPSIDSLLRHQVGACVAPALAWPRQTTKTSKFSDVQSVTVVSMFSTLQSRGRQFHKCPTCRRRPPPPSRAPRRLGALLAAWSTKAGPIILSTHQCPSRCAISALRVHVLYVAEQSAPIPQVPHLQTSAASSPEGSKEALPPFAIERLQGGAYHIAHVPVPPQM
jgi:hypothetical protein